ncbi:MAG: sulfatase-like hydrolase/transferase, partial [Thermoanaerobaculia bacterium]
MRRALLTLAILAVSCSRETPVEPAVSVPGAPVIVISIDTLRSDRLPAYGYKGVETPNLDRFRADAILFERAYSHSPMTLPAHVSMLTGLLPNEHGVRNNIGYHYDPAAHPPLTAALKKRGYVAGAAVSSYVLRGESGLAGAFDFYEDSIAPHPGAEFGEYQRTGDRTSALALPWIETNRAKPFFFLFHIYEPHVPYAPPEPFRSRYASAYDGEIAAADAIVGAFLSRLREVGIYDRALIIVTSDHGEGLGDHGEAQHSILLYREAIQVPLLVKLPGGSRRGTSVEHPVGLADIAPTVLAVAGVTGPVTGARSLLDPAAGRAIYSETLYPRIHFGWSELKSLVSGRHHYIQAPRPELYDVVADPAEKQNLAGMERRTATALRETLARIPAGTDSFEPIRKEDAAKLGSLGYLGRTAGASTPNENPIDHIALIERMRIAYVLAEQKQFDEAERALGSLLEERPSLIDARLRLAELLVEKGRDDLAIAQYDELMQRSTIPLPDAMLAAAALLLRQGQIDDAEIRARAALSS